MPDIELEDIDVEVYTRIYLLAVTITEFAIAFGADDACIQSIEKGVYERQIIEKIFLYYYNDENELVGRIIFSIDWNAHKIKVADEGGNRFEFKTNKSILEQLDKSTGEIIRHVDRMRKYLHVAKIESSYRYRAEYTINEQKRKEVQQYLGHIDDKNRGSVKKSDLFEHTIKYILDSLEELEITISNN